ncbi:hypothetical protein AB0M95_04400 [Sphaerisporangium sp. NPDC051017]|uniref:hypothetical protein n=1 Tax=Sphaerisporangium sp. NPDC051017 TaxID=3154636 RepID=UPI003425C721
MSTVPPGTGPLSPDFTGIDPNLMDGLITELEKARSVIGEHTEAIRRVYASNALPATSLTPIAEIEHWIDQKLPDLRRRTHLARATANLPNWSPGTASALIPYEEKPALPPAEARRLGTDLASQYKKIDPDALFQSGRPEMCAKVLQTLAAHIHDPEYTASFFAALGVEAALRLPVVLRDHLQPGEEATLAPPRPGDEILHTISQAFATAVSAGTHVPRFSSIYEKLRNSGLSMRQQFGASLLLSGAKYPTEWLAQVALKNGFGSPRKVNLGFVYALANNPAAARLAITQATGGDTAKLKSLLKEFSERSTGIYATASDGDAFGRLLPAAAGVYDEQDGMHSKESALFAFTLMSTINELKIAPEVKPYLSQIAGSYATEMVEGADFSNSNHLLPSAFGEVKSHIFGLKPAFRLSPEDTYRFIKLFADNLDDQMPFQAGMEALTTRLIVSAVPDMMHSKNPERLDGIFSALGSVRGVQLAAREKLGQLKDDAAEERSKLVSLLLGTGMGVVAIKGPIADIPIWWTVISAGWSSVDTYKQEDEKEVDKIRTATELDTLGRQHTIAQALLAAGFKTKISPKDYQATCPPGVSITDAHGQLRPFTDILESGNKGLDALDRWLLLNGMGGPDTSSLGTASDRLASTFEGRMIRAKVRASQFEKGS